MKYAPLLLALLATTPAAAQWQVPNGAVPLGRGAGVTGFSSVTGSAGAGAQCLIDTTPPTFAACPPGTGAALTKTDDTNVTLTLGGSPATSLLRAASLTLGWTGTLSTARGGLGQNASAQTGIALNTAGTFTWLASSGTGNVARVTSPVFVTPDLGTPSAVNLANGTNLPIANTTGTLAVNRGGTGQTSLSAALDTFSSTQGSVLYRNATQWVALAPGTAGQFFTTQGAGANPNWSSGGAGTGTVTSVQCGPTITASGVCSQPYEPMNCSLGASNNGTLLTVNLLDGSGATPSSASPCVVPFRSATLATGSWSVLVISGALSINTNAAGATLGSSNSSPFRLWVAAFNNSGTPVLALFNASTGSDVFSINEANLKSTTPMSASATSAGVFYTPNGTTLSNMPLKVLGYVEYASGLTTAGTYASNPTTIQTKGPGVQLPGSIISVSTVLTTTTTTATAGTNVPTTAAKNITLDSPVNLVELSAGGTMLTPAAGSGALRLYRGNAACTTGIGPDSAVSSNTVLPGLGALSWIDKPGTTAANYTVCLAAAGGSATFPWSAFPNATLTLKQIQG